jgi:hypothetical protein
MIVSVVIVVLCSLGYLEFIFAAGNHLFWFSKRKERMTWPWNWRLLTLPSKYVDWRYDMYGYGGPRYSATPLTNWVVGTTSLPLLPYPRFSVNLPERTQADPFVGYKTMRLIENNGQILFRGCTGAQYGLDATASCAINSSYAAYVRTGIMTPQEAAAQELDSFGNFDHPVPDPTCSCGFYALTERPNDWEYGVFMAQVELYGRVICGERGWRAEYQRILRLEAKENCISERHRGANPSAIGFIRANDDTIVPVCRTHGNDHAGFMDLAELTGRIGTEVVWAGDVK